MRAGAFSFHLRDNSLPVVLITTNFAVILQVQQNRKTKKRMKLREKERRWRGFIFEEYFPESWHEIRANASLSREFFQSHEICCQTSEDFVMCFVGTIDRLKEAAYSRLKWNEGKSELKANAWRMRGAERRERASRDRDVRDLWENFDSPLWRFNDKCKYLTSSSQASKMY